MARFVHTTARVAAPAGSTNLALVVEPAVRLDVVLELGEVRGPLREAHVTAVPVDPGLPTEDVLTDRGGRVSLALRPGVEYTIRAEREGYAPAERTGVRGGGEGPLVIEMTAAAPPR